MNTDVKATVEEWLNMLILELSSEQLKALKKAINEGNITLLDEKNEHLYEFIKEYESDWNQLPSALK